MMISSSANLLFPDGNGPKWRFLHEVAIAFVSSSRKTESVNLELY